MCRELRSPGLPVRSTRWFTSTSPRVSLDHDAGAEPVVFLSVLDSGLDAMRRWVWESSTRLDNS